MTYVVLMRPPNRIRELRLKRGLSQTVLGERVGLTQGQVGHLENGARNLTLEWMKRIARAMDVSVAELLIDEDNPDRLDPEERQLVEAMRRVAGPARQHMKAMAQAIAQVEGDGDEEIAA